MQLSPQDGLPSWVASLCCGLYACPEGYSVLCKQLWQLMQKPMIPACGRTPGLAVLRLYIASYYKAVACHAWGALS